MFCGDLYTFDYVFDELGFIFCIGLGTFNLDNVQLDFKPDI